MINLFLHHSHLQKYY